MVTPAKESTVKEITERFRNSTATVVTEYRGLKMSELSKLRHDLGSDVVYTVAKNTLVRRAAAAAGVEGLDELFNGPTAIAFVTGEPVNAAKALRDFAKTNALLVIKGGVMDGKVLNPHEVGKLADLESREVLLGNLAGAMKATLTQAAVMFNQLPSQVARLAAALQEKKIAAGETVEAPAAASTEPAPADAAPTTESAPADEVAATHKVAATDAAPAAETDQSAEAAATESAPAEDADATSTDETA